MDIQAINQLLVDNILYIMIGVAATILLLIILLIVTMVKLKKVQKSYRTFMQKDDVDLETLLVHYSHRVSKIQDSHDKIYASIKNLEDRLAFCIQKVGVVRYKALQDVGADLSFAIALLDESHNGTVINGIYGRNSSYTYAKPIQNGTSTYTLSDEEKEAIEKAINESYRG